MNARTAAVGIGALVLALIFGLLFFTSMVDEETQQACPTIGGNASPALFVDPAAIPVDEIAGYGREQLVNAAYIMAAGRDLGLSARDQTIGVMTAMGESGLRVLDHGDAVGPDSRGLFQQRDNGAWGSLEDRMDPYRSATNFFRALMAITDRAQLEPTLVANRVQRNADPYYYRTYWPAAQAVTAGLGGVTPASAIPAVATGGSYNLGPVQPQLAHLVDVLAPMFGITTVGGWRASATDMAGHPAGLAADFMVPISAAGQAQGDALAAYAQGHAAELGVDYILWRQRVWSTARAAEGWRPMEDRGSPTANHVDHVHINVVGNPGADTATTIGVNADCTPTISGGWMAPVQGEISSPFGPRTHPVTGEPSFHDGADYAAACGTPIHAAHSGLVVSVAPSVAYGVLVTIDHGGGVLTSYGHMTTDSVSVRVGDAVSTGQVIAAVGSEGYSTGCHVHFIVEAAGSPVDPVTFLAQQAQIGLRVATFNVLGASHTDGQKPRRGYADSATRMQGAVALLDSQQATLVGFQELQEPQHNTFVSLRGSQWSTFHADGDTENAIAWRNDVWTALDKRLLSVPYFEHDRQMPVVQLRSTSGTTLWVINVHNPADTSRYPNSKARRAEALRRELELVSQLASTGPVLLLGDLNDYEQAYCPAARAGMTAPNGGTVTATSCTPPTRRTIDWILGTGITWTDYTQDTTTLTSKISDHPLIAAGLSG